MPLHRSEDHRHSSSTKQIQSSLDQSLNVQAASPTVSVLPTTHDRIYGKRTPKKILPYPRPTRTMVFPPNPTHNHLVRKKLNLPYPIPTKTMVFPPNSRHNFLVSKRKRPAHIMSREMFKHLREKKFPQATSLPANLQSLRDPASFDEHPPQDQIPQRKKLSLFEHLELLKTESKISNKKQLTLFAHLKRVQKRETTQPKIDPQTTCRPF